MPLPDMFDGISGSSKSKDNELMAALKRLGINIPGSKTAGSDETDLSGDFSTTQKLFGGTAEDGSQVNGAISTGLDVGTGLLGGYLGLKQLGLAEDTFKQNKKEFNLNYDAQQQNVNSQLRDRQRNRVRGNPEAYESVATYMDRNRVRNR